MYGKILKNFFFLVLKYFITLVVGFIATPLILKFVGSKEYGVYTLILEYLGYLSLGDLGLSVTTNTLLNRAWAENDRNLTVRTIKFLAKEYLKTIPVILLIISGIYFSLFKFSLAGEVSQAHIVSFLIMSLTGFMTPLNTFRDYLICSERSFIVSKVNILQLLVLTCLNVLLSYLGVGLVGLAISFFSAIALFHLFNVFIALKKIKEMPLKNNYLDITVQEVWQFNRHSMIQSLLGRMCYSTDTIILSLFGTPSLVTQFVLNQKLAKLSDNVINSIGNGAWATLANVRNDHIARQRFIDLVNKGLLIIAYPLLISMAKVNKDFMNLWVGNDLYLSEAFTLISFSNYLIFGAFSFWGWIFVSESSVPKLTSTILISGLLNIGLSFGATNYLVGMGGTYASLGPVLGTCISFYSVYLWMIQYKLKREFNISVMSFIVHFLALTVIFGFLYKHLDYVMFFDKNHWLGLILNCGLVYLFSLAIVGVVVARKSEVKSLINLLRRKGISS